MLRLETVQIIDGAVRVGSGLKNCAVVVLEHLKPSGYIGCVILLDLRCEFEISAKESGARFGDEFLASIALITPGLAAKVAFDARRVLGATGDAANSSGATWVLRF